MRNLNDLLVTTTSSIDGMAIKQYLKPISAHVVAGTNFFSDFFASWTDLLGGRSNTYQRQLSSIYTEAIEVLKQSASELGANCIIGLKVDLDEISGKGKSMFMITAIGTAVIVENLNRSLDLKKPLDKLEYLSIDKMEELRKRKDLIQLAQDKKLELDDTTWNFLCQNKVNEISRQIIEITNKTYNAFGDSISEKQFQQLYSYLATLTEDELTVLLYDYLMNEKSGAFTKIIYRLIKDLMVFDGKKLEHYLQDKDEENRIKALQIVVTDKPFFTKEDILEYKILINLIDQIFPKTAKTGTTKNFLSSKEVEVWVCECGNKNDPSKEYCENINCGKDPYGFKRDQISPRFALKKLKENIDLIETNVVN